jgi:hypothetical protein
MRCRLPRYTVAFPEPSSRQAPSGEPHWTRRVTRSEIRLRRSRARRLCFRPISAARARGSAPSGVTIAFRESDRPDIPRGNDPYGDQGITSARNPARVVCHALTRRAVGGGRLHSPDDAQVDPREVAVERRAIASVGLLTAGLPRPRERIARLAHARGPSIRIASESLS